MAQLTDEQRARALALIERVLWGDMDRCIRSMEEALRLAMEATADDFRRWEEHLGPVEAHGGDEFTVSSEMVEAMPDEDKLAYVARLLRSAALMYGVPTEYGDPLASAAEFRERDPAALLHGLNDIVSLPVTPSEVEALRRDLDEHNERAMSDERKTGPYDPDAWEGDVDRLVGWADLLAQDDDAAEETFAGEREAFSTGWSLGYRAAALYFKPETRDLNRDDEIEEFRRELTEDGGDMEDLITERALSRSLTSDQRYPGDNRMENLIAHDAALLDEFFATLPERIAFWTERCNALWDAHTHVTIGQVKIAVYVERLDWVNLACRNDPEFLALHGHYRFHVVAAALAYGVGPATQYLRFLSGDADDWDYDDEHAFYADRELAFLIYQQRGSAVEFRPELLKRDLDQNDEVEEFRRELNEDEGSGT